MIAAKCACTNSGAKMARQRGMFLRDSLDRHFDCTGSVKPRAFRGGGGASVAPAKPNGALQLSCECVNFVLCLCSTFFIAAGSGFLELRVKLIQSPLVGGLGSFVEHLPGVFRPAGVHASSGQLILAHLAEMRL